MTDSPTSDPQRQRRRLSVPVVALLVLIPLLYVLSAAPVLRGITGGDWIPIAEDAVVAHGWVSRFSDGIELWRHWYGPALWLAKRPLLERPLGWWADVWDVGHGFEYMVEYAD